MNCAPVQSPGQRGRSGLWVILVADGGYGVL